ncbi:proton-conducting transporter membrane subunit [Picrophilus oshimae]|uniref:Oxidoreductase n=1 Tax=Picrophilus torridus (strain ATCC 700027 / DSM 9790 / JCM 10055 / NBRC 100828 / KAW 2/3) TaxID=1122961 RepID=Q6L0U3_PICTO|nr:proton-conducting transporter membrane subunit [Picrophilus oshimae]AAT43409.1 oxidoreductase [Picrophilus oshimae DSM 9789]
MMYIILFFIIAALISFIFKRTGYIISVISSFLLIIYGIINFSYLHFFYIISGTVWALSSWYSISYDDEKRYLSILYNISILGMVTVLISNNYLMFLAGWETMSISGYLIIALYSNKSYPAFVFSAFSEISTVLIITGFAYAYYITGTFNFVIIKSIVPLIMVSFGFMTKMGMFPFMISEWLPIGHGNAPANASIILSATMTLMGVYGILKMAMLSPYNIYLGYILMLIGAFTVLFAGLYSYLSDHVKSLPAFSTVENNGGILVALGLYISVDDSLIRIFFLSTVLIFSMAHSLAKTGIFMVSGNVSSRTHEYLFNIEDKKSGMTYIGAVILGASLSGLYPTIGGVATWMLLESLFMNAIYSVYGVYSIIIGAMIALGEGLVSAAYIKYITFSQLFRKKGRVKIKEQPVIITGALVIILSLLSVLIINRNFISGFESIGIANGFLIESRYSSGDFGLIAPAYAIAIIAISFLLSLIIFKKPRIRYNIPWNNGLSYFERYNSIAFTSNIKAMLSKLITEKIDVFWEVMILISVEYRKFAKKLLYKIMSSSMSIYMLYMVLGLFFAIIFVYIFY